MQNEHGWFTVTSGKIDFVLHLIVLLLSYLTIHLLIVHSYDCTHGEIRLRNGLTSREGRVEICVDGTWGTVCHSGWSYNDARVVCKQLGYPTLGKN